MLQRSLGYTINKFGRFYRVPEKSRHFQENEKLQLFYQKLVLIQNFDYLSKTGKGNWVSALLSSEMHHLSIGQGLTPSPMENNRVFLLIF